MIHRETVTYPTEAANALFVLIRDKLTKGDKVLWLISGGSSLPIAAEVSHLLKTTNQTNLFISLIDDQYLPKGDEQTNGAQLIKQGFKLDGAEFMEILQNETQGKTASAFNDMLSQRLQWADFSIGQFGLGAGYHTGGIQPGSPAAKENKHLAITYKDGGIWRITVTPILIARLDTAFINSIGKEKRELVLGFCKSVSTIDDEPTQALKMAKETLLYTDIIDESS
jgi:6-phosphogluconolactonase/glucosamine-6-phosphate isomerase/deaminase